MIALDSLLGNTAGVTCCSCGLTFSVAKAWVDERRAKHDKVYCPNGHQLYFGGKSEADKLRDEKAALERKLKSVEADREWQTKMRDRADRQAAAARGQVAKIRRRVGAGVCPCCNRTFQQLADHMKTKHPEYGPALAPKETTK